MYFLLKMGIFHGYVSLPEGNPNLQNDGPNLLFQSPPSHVFQSPREDRCYQSSPPNSHLLRVRPLGGSFHTSRFGMTEGYPLILKN